MLLSIFSFHLRSSIMDTHNRTILFLASNFSHYKYSPVRPQSSLPNLELFHKISFCLFFLYSFSHPLYITYISSLSNSHLYRVFTFIQDLNPYSHPHLQLVILSLILSFSWIRQMYNELKNQLNIILKSQMEKVSLIPRIEQPSGISSDKHLTS